MGFPFDRLTFPEAQESCPDRCKDRNPIQGYVGLSRIEQLHASGAATFLPLLGIVAPAGALLPDYGVANLHPNDVRSCPFSRPSERQPPRKRLSLPGRSLLEAFRGGLQGKHQRIGERAQRDRNSNTRSVAAPVVDGEVSRCRGREPRYPGGGEEGPKQAAQSAGAEQPDQEQVRRARSAHRRQSRARPRRRPASRRSE